MSFGLNSRVRQRRRRRKLFKSKAVSCQVDKNTGTDILRFFCCPGGILETRKLFLWHILLKTPYIHICPCSWALGIQGHWDLDLFWFGDGRICAVFQPLCDLYKSTQTRHFFYCTCELHFFRRIFWGYQKPDPFGVQRVKLTLRWRDEQGFKKVADQI